MSPGENHDSSCFRTVAVKISTADEVPCGHVILQVFGARVQFFDRLLIAVGTPPNPAVRIR
jgi:hypothetical protein